jgi:hypothetical protein
MLTFVALDQGLGPSPPPPRRWLRAADFEASAGEDDEPISIARRATGADVVTAEIVQEGRTLKVCYELADPTLDAGDVKWLFIACYLCEFANNYYADKVDQITLRSKRNADEVMMFPYPRHA